MDGGEVGAAAGCDRFEDRVVLVTGGTAGIGLATAREVVAEGGRVVVNGRDEQRADEAVDALGGGTSAAAAIGDITDVATVASLVRTAMARWGRVDALVNNAGGGTGVRDLAAVDADDLRRCLALNLDAVVATTRAVVPVMADAGGGCIVNVTSVAGRDAGRISGPQYAAAKAGVHGLTRHLARDLGGDGIRVNAVAPGYVATERAAAMLAALPVADRRRVEDVPLGRPGTPREVARAIVFLASDDSSYITGATIDVNGGSWMP